MKRTIYFLKNYLENGCTKNKSVFIFSNLKSALIYSRYIFIKNFLKILAVVKRNKRKNVKLGKCQNSGVLFCD